MSVTAAVTSYVAVLPAELPDKTIFACLMLASRYRPLYVFTGAATAFAAQVALAVAVGGAVSLLPHRWVYAATAAAFLAGAVLLWRQHPGQEDDDEIGRDGVRSAFWPVTATSFVVVFLAEFGDLTQITTAGLAARFHDPYGVGIGATLALWTAAAVAVLVGWRLLKFIRVSWLTRGAAVVMLVLAGTSAFAAAALAGQVRQRPGDPV
jgi:Ca2+/H+ antiporter, TMEM165/GDT1 family